MRGQAHTLEAVAAALLLLTSIAIALQITAVTPLSGSTSSQQIENQQAAISEGILAAAAENESVVPTLLYWNRTGGKFWNATQIGYPTGGPPTPFGDLLDQTLEDRGIAFNVNLYYMTGDGSRVRHRLVYMGSPSDHASTARRTFPLYDTDQFRAPDGSVTGVTLAEDGESYFAPDSSPSTPLYNVIQVEVVAWQM